jgi:hypothetical protein
MPSIAAAGTTVASAQALAAHEVERHATAAGRVRRAPMSVSIRPADTQGQYVHSRITSPRSGELAFGDQPTAVVTVRRSMVSGRWAVVARPISRTRAPIAASFASGMDAGSGRAPIIASTRP